MTARTASDYRAKHDPLTIISKLEKELRDANSQIGLQAVVKELLNTTVLRLDQVRAPAWTIKPQAGSAPGVPTLFLSDLHWDEVVQPAQIGGVNSYNRAIAHKRLAYTVETAIHLLRILDPAMRYPGIVCPLGGDMVSGNIHEELAATNEANIMATVLDLFEQIVRALKTLADTFGHVFCPCVSGNHGRNTKKTWSKDRNHTSFDWLLYQMVARHFAAIGDVRITFYIPEGSDALYRIYSTRYLLTHGDQFKAGDSIIGPIGPLMRGNQKKTARNQAVGQDYDVMMCGHWHQYIHFERLIVNGSLKGYDEYAAQGNFGFEPPRQALFVTHPRYGITYRMPVLCEPPAKVKKKAAWTSTPNI